MLEWLLALLSSILGNVAAALIVQVVAPKRDAAPRKKSAPEHRPKGGKHYRS